MDVLDPELQKLSKAFHPVVGNQNIYTTALFESRALSILLIAVALDCWYVEIVA